MTPRPSHATTAGTIGETAPRRLLFFPLMVVFCLAAGLGPATGAERVEAAPLRVAVYDLAPYGSVGPDGAFLGVGVDLWRRVAEELGSQYKLTPVSQMDAVLAGLEQGRFDAAIGAITITPERAARVDFSYPAHRSGVAVALHKEAGPISALVAYGLVAVELSSLIVTMLVLLLLIGVAMWFIEKPSRSSAATDLSVVTLRDGIYWAVVTMTTVGYGDKTPKTPFGRFVAIVWMLGSVALVSLLSASSRFAPHRRAGGKQRAFHREGSRRQAARRGRFFLGRRVFGFSAPRVQEIR